MHTIRHGNNDQFQDREIKLMLDKFQQSGERLVKLRAMLRARKDRPGYDRNVLEIEAEIDRLEKQAEELARGLESQFG